MKFNYVLGNPPYEGRSFLYIKILYSAWKNTSGLTWLCPTTFIDGIYKRNETFNRAIKNFEKYLKKFEDVDPSGFDMLVGQDSLGVFFFSENNELPIDMWNLSWRKFKDKDSVKKICKKIEKYCKDNNLKKNRLAPKKIIGTKPEKDPDFKCNKDKWYLGCSWVRGTLNDWTWISLLGEKDVPIKGALRDSWFHAWEFNTENEADEFKDYLNKSDILKFSVHIEKNNQTNNPSDFVFFPSCNLPWSEDKLAELIGITKQERSLISEIISVYSKPC